jgi:trehalose synthase
LIETVPVNETQTLDDYEAIIHLSQAVRDLRAEARSLVPQLEGRTVWMVNSTARGGGVAEMLPRMVTILRELGVATEWLVIGSDKPEFFTLTKRLHNLIHGSGDPEFTADDHAVYDAVSRENADALKAHVKPGDLLVVHDPQPLGSGALVRRELDVRTIFRCHIGLDESTRQTRAAWDFLKPYADVYDHAVFTAPEYIPDFLAGRTGVIRPAIDPLGFKNRELLVTRLVGILCNARLAAEQHPVVPAEYTHVATRLAPDGRFLPADHSGGIGILFRPIVTQISRWDRLKGFKPLLDGFVRLKQRAERNTAPDGHQRRLQLVRLVLAGPEPSAVADDPEATEVLKELIDAYTNLPRHLQEDIALVSLPMSVRKHNELIVNALQRCSSVVVQNSLREGFGLTVTEAMWKHAAVFGSRACGIRQQVRDGVDGWLIQNPEAPEEISVRLDALLEDIGGRIRLGQTAQRRVHDEFLVFTQVHNWLTTLVDTLQRDHH